MSQRAIEKNILDLQHSVSLAKGITFLALGFSSWITLFFGMKEFSFDLRLVVFLATFISLLFFYFAFQFFKSCETIHYRLRGL